jgi:hypothetical protein
LATEALQPFSRDQGLRPGADYPDATGAQWDDPVSPEEAQRKEEDARRAKREAFTQSLIKKRSEAIAYRAASGVETRWIQDTDAYHGRDSSSRIDENWDVLALGGVTPQAPAKRSGRRSRVYVGITRQKTNVAVARAQDMLFPSDERNWETLPTPDPTIAGLVDDFANSRVKDPKPGPTQGQELPHPTEDRPLVVADIAAEKMRAARKANELMQRRIDDQHVECCYQEQGRRAIEDAGKLGTGILKGPVVVNRIKKAWLKDPATKQWTMKIQQDITPASFRVDPWNFFPAAGCGDDIQKGGGAWEREPVSPGSLRDLARVETYDREAIAECLREGPMNTVGDLLLSKRRYLDAGEFDKQNYDLWNYTGECSVEDLEALGVKVQTNAEILQKVSAMVVICNGRIIKAILNPMDTGDLPYDMFVWDSIDDGPWGVGIPYAMRYGQRSLNAAWRQMQDNAGVSHGPQIVMNRKLIEPADKDWNISGMKLWYTKGDAQVEDVTKAFQVFQVNSNQPQLEAIIQLCLKFIDDETAIPMLAHGEKGTAPDKVGIVSMLMNASNVVLKRIARNWDGRVTNPHIRRYYDWNMQYSEDESIKGDFHVHALGSTTLVVRDQQKQDIANLMAMSQLPQYARHVNPRKVMEYAWKMSSVPDVLYSEDEMKEIEAREAQQKPPEDPGIAIARIRAEAAVAAEKVEAESERVNQELRMEEAKRNDEREIYKMELERDLKILESAARMDMTIAQIKGMLAGKVMDAQVKTRLAETAAAKQGMGDGNFKQPKRAPAVRPPRSKEPAQYAKRPT